MYFWALLSLKVGYCVCVLYITNYAAVFNKQSVIHIITATLWRSAFPERESAFSRHAL